MYINMYIKPVRFLSGGAILGWVEPLCEIFQFTSDAVIFKN